MDSLLKQCIKIKLTTNVIRQMTAWIRMPNVLAHVLNTLDWVHMFASVEPTTLRPSISMTTATDAVSYIKSLLIKTFKKYL